MNKYNELKHKDDLFMWAYEEFQRDPGYWLERAKNGKGLIKEIAEFVVRNGNSNGNGNSKPQQEKECPVFTEKRSNPPIVTVRGKFTRVYEK